MEKILSLIQEKNMYLEKFCGINTEQIKKLNAGNFQELEAFRESREKILNILKHLDALLSAHAATVDEEGILAPQRTDLRRLLDRKDDLVRIVLRQDIDIMGAIEIAKSEIIRQLRSVVRGRKTIKSYKSGAAKDGLDEEI